jgi:hypothetical protein
MDVHGTGLCATSLEAKTLIKPITNPSNICIKPTTHRLIPYVAAKNANRDATAIQTSNDIIGVFCKKNTHTHRRNSNLWRREKEIVQPNEYCGQQNGARSHTAPIKLEADGNVAAAPRKVCFGLINQIYVLQKEQGIICEVIVWLVLVKRQHNTSDLLFKFSLVYYRKRKGWNRDKTSLITGLQKVGQSRKKGKNSVVAEETKRFL